MKRALFVFLLISFALPAFGARVRLDKGDGLLDALVVADCDIGWLVKVMEANDLEVEELGFLQEDQIIKIPDSLIGQEPDQETRRRSAEILRSHEKELNGTNGSEQETPQNEAPGSSEVIPEEPHLSKDLANALGEVEKAKGVNSELSLKIKTLESELLQEKSKTPSTQNPKKDLALVIIPALSTALVIFLLAWAYRYSYKEKNITRPWSIRKLAPNGKIVIFELEEVYYECPLCKTGIPEDDLDKHVGEHDELREVDLQGQTVV